MKGNKSNRGRSTYEGGIEEDKGGQFKKDGIEHINNKGKIVYVGEIWNNIKDKESIYDVIISCFNEKILGESFKDGNSTINEKKKENENEDKLSKQLSKQISAKEKENKLYNVRNI